MRVMVSKAVDGEFKVRVEGDRRHKGMQSAVRLVKGGEVGAEVAKLIVEVKEKAGLDPLGPGIL